MMRGDIDSLSAYKSHPYSSSLASSASSSSASVWSDAASSQHSDDTSAPASSCDSQCESFCSQPPALLRSESLDSTNLHNVRQAQQACPEVPRELRQNSRRTSSTAAPRCPPPMVRQSERKGNFVDNLVDTSTQIVEAIWPLSTVVCRVDARNKAVLPLRTFIQETLRRSRTSYSTLQVALYYLVLIKPHVPKHDFTMEQPDDNHANRVLQCGRRMFLAALILASKYLQDRNYSARAWSKISGLGTQEINQNEMAFLLAVDWKLHITDAVFQRWTDIVLKYTPSQSSSPGGSLAVNDGETQIWKNLILRLNTDLDNVDGIIATRRPSVAKTVPSVLSPNPRSLLAARERSRGGYDSSDVTPTPRTYNTPTTMEPSPASAYIPGLQAPALGLLPTPRLTPQSTGYGTPAVNAASCLLNGRGSMSLAMAQASHTSATHGVDRWPVSMTSSPQSYYTRRSSLANSISTASSPESMISDSSRSSSISSASSLSSAPSTKLDVQARCRYAKLCSDRYSSRPSIASVPEDYEEDRVTSSPDSYAGAVDKGMLQMSLDTPTAQRGVANDDDAEAARALQEMHKYQYPPTLGTQSTKTAGAKRSRTMSMDNPLHENVREMLNGQPYSIGYRSWPESMVRSRADQSGGCKRMCYSSDVSAPYTIPPMRLAFGGGMCDGIA